MFHMQKTKAYQDKQNSQLL